jgi:hypothetical protein
VSNSGRWWPGYPYLSQEVAEEPHEKTDEYNLRYNEDDGT